jgi:hypothetical protein
MKRLAAIFIALILCVASTVHAQMNLLTGAGGRFKPATASYTAQGVNFNNAPTYLTRGAALTGAASGKKGTISFWFKAHAGNNQSMSFLEPNVITGAGYLFIRRDATNKILVEGRGGFSTQLSIISTTTYTSSMTSWSHCAASWDLSVTTGKMYCDGVDVTGTTTLNNANLEYGSPTNWGIGAKPDGTFVLNNMDVAELYVNFSDYLDLSVAANLQKFRSAGGAQGGFGGWPGFGVHRQRELLERDLDLVPVLLFDFGQCGSAA